MIIKILGTWCPKCKLLQKTVEETAKKLEFNYEIIKIDDIQEIAEYNIMTLPALIIDDMLVLAWWSPEPEEMLDILQDIHDHKGDSCCRWDKCWSDGECCGWCHS